MIKKVFFDGIRSGPFPGKLSVTQVGGITYILEEFERRGLTDLRYLAYILATVFWETARTMEPVTEYGSKAYLRAKKYWPWIGRGYVQLTWEANYQKFRERVLERFGVDICATPDAALQPDVACFILFEGMLNGEFTGKKLFQFFNSETTDWINARKIINGLDKAREIAGIAKQFFADLVAAKGTEV